MHKDHIQLSVEQIPEMVFLPGDPERVDEISRYLSNVQHLGNNREYRTVSGEIDGTSVGVCSTGMGGPSTEIAVVELFEKGARRFIRIGTAGALQPHIEVGDLIIATGCIRESGTARSYVPDTYPAVANYEMVLALIQACEELKYPYHVGLGLSVDCFYATKPELFGDRIPSQISPMLSEYVKAGALQMEMEAATVMVLAQILGASAAAICTVGSNQITKEPSKSAPTNERAIQAACRGAQILSQWDRLRLEQGASNFYPILQKG
ncbi:MAG: nucleoside phosphorylase [Firmicutes bacterium]|nr:nucleoside phosphorylase [Bacillota bacterium]